MPSREAAQLRHEAGGEVRQVSGVPPGHTPITVVGEVRVSVGLDPYLSLKALANYSGLSRRTLQAYLYDPRHPIPFYQLGERKWITRRHKIKGTEEVQSQRLLVGGKILVRRSDFDRWIAAHKATSPLDTMVNDVIRDLREATRRQ